MLHYHDFLDFWIILDYLAELEKKVVWIYEVDHFFIESFEFECYSNLLPKPKMKLDEKTLEPKASHQNKASYGAEKSNEISMSKHAQIQSQIENCYVLTAE